MNGCLFCKIAAGEIPSTKVYEDEKFYSFLDINPQAKVHALIIPREHYADMAELSKKDPALAGKMLKTACLVAEQLGLKNGFRLITNTGADARQSVRHTHVHILGGEELSERMG
ncbi:MAG: histidine triad nucleotide-binding protein [Clostridia bacterium]|nr:histidine triad nucleotide-binding protein [Clostridia bacterium]